MPPECPIWKQIQSYGAICRCREVPVSRVTSPLPGHRGDQDGTFIVTNEMNVYRSFPLLHVPTGNIEELWLTQAQVRAYQEHQEPKAPHPRLFDLPKIGLKPAKNRQEPLQGFSGGTTFNIVFDNEGHLWHGSPEQHVSCYLHKETNRTPVIRFFYPYMIYIGPDREDLWLARWGAAGEKERIYICTYAIHRAIEKAGLKSHYIPQGRARTSLKIATKQMAVAKARLIMDVDDKVDERTDQLRTEIDESKRDLLSEMNDHKVTLEKLAQKGDDATRIAQELKYAQERNGQLMDQIVGLEEELAEALSAVEKVAGGGFSLAHV